MLSHQLFLENNVSRQIAANSQVLSDNTENHDTSDRLWRARCVLSELTGSPRITTHEVRRPLRSNLLCSSKDVWPSSSISHPNPHIFGLKFFVLCDYVTGMIIDKIKYSISDIKIPNNDLPGFLESEVMTLIAPTLNRDLIL